jgi:hypothetical protein
MNAPIAIFLLIGQSNMAGRGPLDAVPPLRHERVQMFRAGAWVKAEEPLHCDKPAVAGVGLGMSFAIDVAKRNPAIVVGLVPCAVGGSKLERWMPGADLYTNAVATTKQAIAQGKLAGILWHQGENDAILPEDAATYAARLTVMIDALRKELGAPDVPFLAGELGAFLKDHPGCKQGFGEVNAQLRSLRGKVPGFRWVGASGLTDRGDHTHFDSPSLRELGRRYARAYLQP